MDATEREGESRGWGLMSDGNLIPFMILVVVVFVAGYSLHGCTACLQFLKIFKTRNWSIFEGMREDVTVSCFRYTLSLLMSHSLQIYGLASIFTEFWALFYMELIEISAKYWKWENVYWEQLGGTNIWSFPSPSPTVSSVALNQM